MSNRLGGKQGTAYTGTNANQPPNWTFESHDPTQYNVQNVSLGDLWLNTTSKDAFMLVSLEGIPGSKGSLATWVKIENNGISNLDALTGDVGGEVNPDNNSNINILSAVSGLAFVGSPNTLTLTSTGSADDVIETVTGNNGGAIEPLNGNINIKGDNVGITIVGNPLTNTLVASLIGGGDAAEDFPTDFGTASANGGVLYINTGNSTLHAGSSVSFSAITTTVADDTVQLNVTDANQNTIIGKNSGNTTPIIGVDNVSLGSACATSLTTGSYNTIVGDASGSSLTTGQYNVLVGFSSGSSYTSSESSNILINSDGTAAESNILRIGLGSGAGIGQLEKAFISGIEGVTPDTADGLPVFIGSAGQLGTVGTGGTMLVGTIEADGGVIVSPLAGKIKIVGDGATATVTGNPGLHTLTIAAVGGGGGTLNNLIDDNGNIVVPAAGQITVTANNTSQGAGSSVKFDGTVASILSLQVTDAINNTIVGKSSGNATLTGINNSVFGSSAGTVITTGFDNTLIGHSAGGLLTTGVVNVALGEHAGGTLVDGSSNVFLGASAGIAYNSNESSNISIGWSAAGTAGENNTLRIGKATGLGAGELNQSIIHGIVGITPVTADGLPVFIGSTGQLGTDGNGGTMLVGTIEADGGVIVSPLAGKIKIVGDGATAAVTGSPGSHQLTVSVIGGGGGGMLNNLVGDDGLLVIPAVGEIDVITNNAILGAGSTVLFSRATTTNILILKVTDGNDNTIIGNGSGTLTVSGSGNTVLGALSASSLSSGNSNTFVGENVGTAITTGSDNIIIGSTAGSSLTLADSTNTLIGNAGIPGKTSFIALAAGSGGNTYLHNYPGVDASTTNGGNIFIGKDAGNFTLNGISFASNNSIGELSLNALTSGTSNNALGSSALSKVTTGKNNTAVGHSAGFSLTTGQFNVLLGSAAGFIYSSNESNNIIINSVGIVGDANTLRIGGSSGTGASQLNKAFIHGIRGRTTGSADAIPVVIDSNGQLGTAGGVNFIQKLTGDTGGAVSALAGNVDIVGDGTTIEVVGSPGLNKLTISALGSGGGAAFLAHLNTPTAISAATPTKIIYDTLQFNRGAGFNLGTSTFTAPTTGLYNFSCSVGYSFGASASAGSYIKLITSKFTYIPWYALETSMKWSTGPGGSGIQLTVGNDVCASMDAGDTATVETYVIFASTILGAASVGALGVTTYFGGSLI